MDVGKGRGEIIISPLNLFYFLPPGLFPKRPPLPSSPLPGGKLRTSKLSENEPTDWGEQRFECAPSALMNLSKKNSPKKHPLYPVSCAKGPVSPRPWWPWIPGWGEGKWGRNGGKRGNTRTGAEQFTLDTVYFSSTGLSLPPAPQDKKTASMTHCPSQHYFQYQNCTREVFVRFQIYLTVKEATVYFLLAWLWL